MGEFIQLVRKSVALSPRRGVFSVAHWEHAFGSVGTPDADDRSLYAAGVALFQKMERIRRQASDLPLSELTKSTRVRACVALANAETMRVRDKADAATIEALSAPDLTPDSSLLTTALGIKLETRDGTSWYPAEIVEAVVDGIQIPIAVALRESEGWGTPRMGEVPWSAVAHELNLGITYRFAEDVWDDCLWNDYRMTEHPYGKIFGPTRPEFQEAQIIGVTRRHAIYMSAEMLGSEAQRTVDALGLPPRVRPVTGIRREGKRQVIQLGAAIGAGRNSATLWTLSALATEPYYEELFDEPIEQLDGLSLGHVLDAWMVIAQTSHLLSSRLDRGPPSGEVNLADFAPTLQVDAITRALSTAAGVGPSGARHLLEFLTFRGRSGQELWAQPLVPVSDRAVSPLFGALHAPALRRVVDVWMRQLGFDMARRGPAFEQYVRNEVAHGIGHSSHLGRSARAVTLAMTFHAGSGQTHELDLVFAVGNTVFVGECKCILEPTDAKSIAMHRKTVFEAAEQVQLRVESIRAHRERFAQQVKAFGLELSGDFEVLPLVVVSTTAHVGVPVGDVPVIDILILTRFIDGFIENVAVFGEERTVARQQITDLYRSADDAERVAAVYFSRPPQIVPYRAGLQPRLVPLHRVAEDDWTGAVVVIDCRPEMKPLPPGLLDLDSHAQAFRDDMPVI